MTANCRSKNIADALAFVGCLVCVIAIACEAPAFAQAQAPSAPDAGRVTGRRGAAAGASSAARLIRRAAGTT